MLIHKEIDCVTEGVYDIPCDRFKKVLKEADINLAVNPDSKIILRCFQEKYKALITREKTKDLNGKQYEIVIQLMKDYFKFYGL